MTSLIVLLYFLVIPIQCFNLGLSPAAYKHGDKVDLLVNRIESDKTQLPFAYHSLSFVCPPMNGAKPVRTSLGALFKGDRIWSSAYDLRFGHDVSCNRLCDLRATQNGVKRASDLIKDGYVVHWSIDGLPGATTFESTNHRNKYYAAGYPLGFVNPDDGISYLYNHVMLVIRYHRVRGTATYNIVGFEVYPKSVINEQCPGSSKDYTNFPLVNIFDENGKFSSERTNIPYTYSVYWREDNTIDYNSRWELYYENEANGAHSHIHWLSFINSMILIFLASLIVMIVLIKVLKKDIQNTTSSPVALPTTSTDLGNTGGSWKNLINEINHVPRAELFLTTLVTAGIQFLIAGIGVIVALMLNSIGSKNTFFNTHQGALLSISIVIIIASGLVSSYVGILLHKYFRGDSLNQPYRNFQILKLGILYTSTPALLWVVMFILNVFVWAKESSAALPFETIILLFALFVLIQWPCGVIGARIANNQKFDIKSPPQSPMLEKPYQAITLLPRKSASKIINIFTSYLKTVVVYGLIPFGIVYVELSFILTSVFLEKTTFYYMYGFLFITVVMLVVLVIESTIIAVYVSLAVYNDPHWTWLSFQVGSSLGWYVFGYAIYYYVRVLNVEEFVSGLLYFVHMAIVSVIIGVSCGAIGVLTGLAFVRKIYGAIKVD